MRVGLDGPFLLAMSAMVSVTKVPNGSLERFIEASRLNSGMCHLCGNFDEKIEWIQDKGWHSKTVALKRLQTTQTSKILIST